MEMADLLSFENHEILRKKFVAALTKRPMTGFQSVGFGQIFDADVEFWMSLADLTRDGIKRGGASIRPCDAAFKEALSSENFTQAMMPRQGSTPSRPSQPHAEHSAAAAAAPSVSKAKRKRDQQAASNIAAAFAPPKKQQQQQKGKAKGDRSNVKLPPGLMGMCARSSPQTGSKRMCFGFNLGTCSACAPGQDCAKGAHLCMKPSANGQACSKAHGAGSCTGA